MGGSNNSTNTRSNKNNKSYCWTHWRTRNLRHVSSNYRNKKDEHKDEAALSNRIGGSDKYCADMWDVGAIINEQSYKIKQFLISNLFSRPPPKTTIVPTIADSGTTHTYIRLQDVINKNTLPTRNPIYVILPSNKHISSSHTTTINFPGLSDNAKNAHVLAD